MTDNNKFSDFWKQNYTPPTDTYGSYSGKSAQFVRERMAPVVRRLASVPRQDKRR
ncbi:hypothetical protein BaRGS_00007679, partial [Batillaria attramentaria]